MCHTLGLHRSFRSILGRKDSYFSRRNGNFSSGGSCIFKGVDQRL